MLIKNGSKLHKIYLGRTLLDLGNLNYCIYYFHIAVKFSLISKV